MVTLEFDWTWIRDKQIDIDGNLNAGLIIITDSEDNIVAIYGYEKIKTENTEEAGDDL